MKLFYQWDEKILLADSFIPLKLMEFNPGRTVLFLPIYRCKPSHGKVLAWYELQTK
jgi:hypothetical protein